MNTEIQNTLPKIKNFPYLSPSLLKDFAAFYTPNMGKAELAHCQKFFAARNQVPPTGEELAFLDAFVAQNYRYPDAFLISQMQTEDDFLAKTFHDLMDKRAIVTPNYSAPCSYAEITKVAQAYLGATDKKTSFIDSLHVSCAPHCNLVLAAQKADAATVDGDSPCGLSCGLSHHGAIACRTALKNGDTVYAVLQSTDARGDEDFEKRLVAFAKSSAVHLYVKKLYPVGKRGLLHTLFDTEMGFEVELSRLYGDAPAKRLLDSDLGLVFIANGEHASGVLMDALDAGLRPRLVGTLMDNGQVVLKHNDRDRLLFTVPFLKALSFSRAYRAEMCDGEVCRKIGLSPVRSTHFGGHDFSFVRADGDDSRHGALYAALCALSSLVACGADLRDVRLAVRTQLSLSDISAQNLGKQLAFLLGLYRAETEFELSELDSSIDLTDQSSSVSLYAMAETINAPISDTLNKDDTSVYLLEPLYDENGNPDFDNLKDMFAYVKALQKNGKVLSARAVFGDILEPLDSMSGDKTIEYTLNAPYAAKAGSILVESAQSITGTLVGKVFPANEESDENPDNA